MYKNKFRLDKKLMEVVTVLLVVTLVTINANFIGIVNRTLGGRCPRTIEEREARSEIVNCSPVEKYHCLFDSEFELVEACSDYKQLPPGNYPRFNSYATGNPIDYDPCPDDRFQPWPVKSYEISECVSLKTTCSGEGQDICEPGTDRTDRKCKCDYMTGYAMNGGVCCSPSELPDCYCFKKICGLNMELDEGYNCIEKCNVLNPNGSCSTPSEDVTVPFSDTSTYGFKQMKGDKRYIQNTDLHILFIIVVIFSFFCFIGFGIYLRQQQYTGRKRKYTFMGIFALVLLGNCAFSYLTYREKIHVNYKINLTALFVLPMSGCICAIIMIYNFDIQKDRRIYNEEYEVKVFRLLNAAKEGNVPELQSLADEKYVEMHVDYDQRSALHLAVCERQEEAVGYLLDHHFCNPDATDRWNRTARSDAEWQKELNEKGDGYDKVIAMLVEYENVSTKKNKMENFREKSATEIIHAAKNGDIHTLKSLWNKKVDMDLSNSAGRTALHAAAENGIIKVVDFLIDECKVSPFVRWVQKRPIDCVPDNGNKVNQGIRKKLRDYMDGLLNADNDKEEESTDEPTKIVRLLNCASRGNIKRMKSFKKANYKMDLCDYDNRTALHIAVSDNQEYIVDFLLGECKLQKKARTMKDRWNNTPLTIAQEPGNEAIYTVFLKHCRELVDTENDEYRTYELLNAGANGNIKVLRRLNMKNVNMNLRDYDGRTALHLAAAENKLDAVKFLLDEAKVERSIPDRENRRPINETTNHEIKTILGNNDTKHENASYIEPSMGSQTLFLVMDAASKGQLHNLIDKNERFLYFSMDSCDYFKNTPLHVAAAKAKLKDVKYLLKERKVSPFVRNSFWKTPMQLVKEKIEYWKKKESVETQEIEKQVSVQVPSSIKISRKQDFIEVMEELENAITESKNKNVTEDENFKKHDSDHERIFMFLNKACKGDLKAIKSFLMTDQKLLYKCNYDKRTALHLAVAEGHYDLVAFIMEKIDEDEIIKKDRWGITPLHEALKNGDENITELFKKKIKQYDLTLRSLNLNIPSHNNENVINDVPLST